jgi:hypothetical protein
MVHQVPQSKGKMNKDFKRPTLVYFILHKLLKNHPTYVEAPGIRALLGFDAIVLLLLLLSLPQWIKKRSLNVKLI